MIMPILAVKDVDASIAFYRDVLGFNHDFSLPGPDGKTSFAGVSLGKAAFGISLEPEAAKGGEGVVFMVYVADDQDLDAYYAEVQGRGAKIDQPIKDEYWGDRVFSLRDPTGYMLSICKTVRQMTMEEIAAAAPRP
jgi:PhnB protein